MLLAVAGDDVDRAHADLGDAPDIGHSVRQRRSAHRAAIADDDDVARLDRPVHQQDDARDQVADGFLKPEADREARGARKDRQRGKVDAEQVDRSEEHTSELQSLMRISYAVFCLKKKKNTMKNTA